MRSESYFIFKSSISEEIRCKSCGSRYHFKFRHNRKVPPNQNSFLFHGRISESFPGKKVLHDVAQFYLDLPLPKKFWKNTTSEQQQLLVRSNIPVLSKLEMFSVLENGTLPSMTFWFIKNLFNFQEKFKRKEKVAFYIHNNVLFCIYYYLYFKYSFTGKPYWRGRLNSVHLLVLTCLD